MDIAVCRISRVLSEPGVRRAPVVEDIRVCVDNFRKNLLIDISRWEGCLSEIGLRSVVGVVQVQVACFSNLIILVIAR